MKNLFRDPSFKKNFPAALLPLRPGGLRVILIGKGASPWAPCRVTTETHCVPYWYRLATWLYNRVISTLIIRVQKLIQNIKTKTQKGSWHMKNTAYATLMSQKPYWHVTSVHLPKDQKLNLRSVNSAEPEKWQLSNQSLSKKSEYKLGML